MEATVYYDGLVFFEMRVRPSHPAIINKLDLVIPVSAELPQMLHSIGEDWKAGETILLQPQGRTLWEAPRKSLVWIGGPRAGLAWFTESFKGWHTRHWSRDVLELVDTEEAKELRIRIIQRPIKVDSPFELSFGFLATPFKPLPRDWRRP